MQEPERLMRDIRLFEENQANRFRLLRDLYGESGGEECLIAFEVLLTVDRDKDDILKAALYLENEGFLLIETSNNTAASPPVSYLRLTHAGIKIAEKTIEADIPAVDRSTPAPVINLFLHCQVQMGNHGSSIATQIPGFDIAEVIEELRRNLGNLPADEQQEAMKVINRLDEEIKSDNPRRGKLESLLLQLGSLALKAGTSARVDV
jgi:hypothetical protein